MTRNRSDERRAGRSRRLRSRALAAALAVAEIVVSSCSGNGNTREGPTITVGVTNVVKKSLGRDITLSSELVPFQEIDVYAKESGYVKNLSVDYGTHVQSGQLMATLEIPELEAQ